jgi:phospholipid N-methyltransferase
MAWAPKQDLFYAIWSPGREDLLLELAGDIEDEETSLEDRAAQRAERFDGYSEKRSDDAEQARKAVSAIADNIPLGQPILVGHHSERHARKDAERIENGMRKAVVMWETKEYWQRRAAASLAHAERHEVPAVRARRIKTLEAAQRKAQRDLAESEKRIRVWSDDTIKHKDGSLTTLAERVNFLARIGAGCSYDLQGKLERGELTPEAAQASVIAGYEASAAHERRWISHLDNRLVYERALLTESGYTPPPKPKSKADLPILNYAGRVAYRTRYSRDVMECEATPMTKAEWAKIHADYKGTVISACGTHRLRTCLLRDHAYHVVVLTDSKQDERPSAAAIAAQAEEDAVARDLLLARKIEQMQARIEASKARAPEREQAAAEAAPFVAIKDALRTGVQVVVAPQLFPTSPALAARMVEMAGIDPGDRVLEPSAGTGNILRAIVDAEVSRREGGPAPHVVAVEINQALADALPKHLASDVVCEDFLKVTSVHPVCPDSEDGFDRVIMNPPFGQAQDIAHIKHALTFLRPGGRLVGICANGPRQQAELRPLATTWEELPEGTFSAQGTNVRTVLLTIDR